MYPTQNEPLFHLDPSCLRWRHALCLSVGLVPTSSSAIRTDMPLGGILRLLHIATQSRHQEQGNPSRADTLINASGARVLRKPFSSAGA